MIHNYIIRWKSVYTICTYSYILYLFLWGEANRFHYHYMFSFYTFMVLLYMLLLYIYILLFTSWLFIIILYNYIVIHIVFICALIYTLRYINDRPYRHPRRGRPYRIEDRLWSFFSSRGLCWRTVALNPGWFDSFEMEFCRQGSQG